MKKLMIALAFLGLTGSAFAQAIVGDIASIHSVYTGANPCSTPGADIRFVIRLGDTDADPYQRFELFPKAAYTNFFTIDELKSMYPLKLKMSTGNYATLVETKYNSTGVYEGKTDFTFSYIVQPGDVGLPLTIAYKSGNENTAGEVYTWLNSEYWNIGDISENNPTFRADPRGDYEWGSSPVATWRLGNFSTLPGESRDASLEKAGIKVQTFMLNDVVELDVGDVREYTLSTTTELSDNLTLYVWSGSPENFTIYNANGVEGEGDNKIVAITVPAGTSSSQPFRLKGLKATTPTANLYISALYGPQEDVSNYYSTVPVTVNSTQPTVILNVDNGGEYDENDTTPHYLTVTLSEPAQQDMTVTLSVPATDADVVKFDDASAGVVTIKKGQVDASPISFYTYDDDNKGQRQVNITSTCSDPYFANKRDAKIIIKNVNPVLSVAVNKQATQDQPHSFIYDFSDVAADKQGDIEISFAGSDGWRQTVTTASGTVSHTFTKTDEYTVTVSARDKDNGVSETLTFEIKVNEPTPQDSVSVVARPGTTDEYDRYSISETATEAGAMMVVLSKKSVEDVTVKLSLDAEGAERIKLLNDTVTILPGNTNAIFRFTVLDGTQDSSATGVKITPSITSSNSSIYPRANAGYVFIENAAPKILAPVNGDDATYRAVPIDYNQTFLFSIEDVVADVIDNDMKLLVNWGDGTDEEEITLADNDDTINVVTNGFSNIGAIKGQIVHKYTTIPSTYYTVTMTVMDKDNTPQATTTFYVRVVPAPVLTVSTVGEIPSTDVICEESDKAFLTPISVKISAMIPYDVNVKLTVEDVNNSGGTLALSSSNVVIKANSLESGKVFITPKDGTEAMPGSQFKIKATIDQTQYESADVYNEVSQIVTGEPVDCVFWVANVPPVAIITSPAGTSAESPLELALNTDVKFSWSSQDVKADSRTAYWSFGDGSTEELAGNSGTTTHTYRTAGNYQVSLYVMDKDGDYSETVFAFVKVTAGKVLEVTEMGPNTTVYKPAGASFSGEMYGRNSGLGAGKVVIPPGVEASYDIKYGGDNVTTYSYGRQVTSATILAIPYRVNSADETATVDVPMSKWNSDGSAFTTNMVPFMYDSFFYTWLPGSITTDMEQGVFVQKDADKPLAPTRVAVNLPAEDGEGNLAQSVMAVAAIFSREYLPHDFTGKTDVNLGDINLDGVPDIIAAKNTGNGMTRAANAAAAMGGGEEGENGDGGNAVDYVATINLGTFNSDWGKDAEGNTVAIGDFLPASLAGSAAQFIPSISNIYAAVGTPFTGILETRGFDNHLNYERDGDGAALDPAYPLDEPGADIGIIGGTDPTLADTDGDGLPDGWEYYFWWFYGHAAEDSGESTKTAGLVGYRYTPGNITDGEPIKRTDIFTAFNPLVGDDAVMTSTGDARDIDNDGLPDVLELTLGTNPVHWDTDGDGLPDGWEVMMGTDPCVSDSHMNIDNDYMAKAIVERTRIPVIRTDDKSVAYYVLADTEGEKFWSEYRYGRGEEVVDSKLPVGEIGQGKPFDRGSLQKNGLEFDLGASEAVEVALVHWQVYQECEFNPMTGWSIHDIDVSANSTNVVDSSYNTSLAGSITNTVEFTAYDEYLVAKVIMNTLSDAPAEMSVADLAMYTTDPRTPDTDVVFAENNGVRQPVLWDGMPDGWELYVALGKEGVSLAEMLISPWNAGDGSTQYGRYDVDGDDGDKLANTSEFSGLRCQVFYTNHLSYTSVFNPAPDPTDEEKGFVSITRPERDLTWLNKFYPSDPWEMDTDGDGLFDGDEQNELFRYKNGIDPLAAIGMSAVEFRGGGLNPCAIDTDHDGLIDAWEVQYAGELVDLKDENGALLNPEKQYIDNGMDPTHGAAADGPFFGDAYSGPDSYAGFEYRDMDWDNDGLENYQEYWTQAIRPYRYDVSYEVVPANAGASAFFTLEAKPWDASGLKADGDPVYFMPPANADELVYASTDPRDPDTDMDGMDDFYEIYHGMNPLLGDVRLSDMLIDLEVADVVGNAFGFKNTVTGEMIKWDDNPLLKGINVKPEVLKTPDYVSFPWLSGMPDIDLDADGLLNFEEYLHGLESYPSAGNTDPSPIWLTDASSPSSIVRSYLPRGCFFWDIVYGKSYEDILLIVPNAKDPINYMYSFEINEGYDTDNDGISDKNELIATSTAQSDPLNSDDPIRRQALWFEGSESAAVSFEHDFARDHSFLKNFTVEFWVKPEDEKADAAGFVSGLKERVFIDRPIYYYNADASDVDGDLRVRSTFRIGYGRLASANNPDKRLYALYENAGGHDAESGASILYGPDVSTNWMHVAATYDSVSEMFTLYVNGRKYAAEGSKLIPANGTSTLNLDADETNKLLSVTSYDYVEGVNAYTNRLVLGAKVAKPVHGAAPTADCVARPGCDPVFDWSMYGAFYKGFIDEVRVWDGARTATEINADYRKRYLRSDELANRDMIVEYRKLGWSRQIGRPQLPAELVYHYTFDNLFSADTPASVATAPRGFMAPSVEANRPAGWTGVAWWQKMRGHNYVYNNYRYLPLIENTMEHLPNYYGMVKDSRYWSKLYAGSIGSLGTAAKDHMIENYSFNFTADPYGLAYRHNRIDEMRSRFGYLLESQLATANTNNLAESARWEYITVNYISLLWSVDAGMDLLPLGNTWAKLAVQMWDNDAPSSVWAETGEDTDNDGLPDWWEIWQASIDSSWVDLTWDSPYPGDPTMTCGEKYMRDIANGYTESNYADPNADRIVQTSDIDMDGLPDWWEDLFNLSASSAEGDYGAYGDPDNDGLCNYAEFLISEYYHAKWPEVFPVVRPDRTASATGQPVTDYYLKNGTQSMYLGLMFTDHDFCDDWWEDLYHVDFANRFVYDSHMDIDDDGWSNWAEARYGASDFRSNPTLKEYLTANGDTATEYPVPVLKTTIQYRGSQSGPIKIKAYSQSSGVNGIADAIFTIPSIHAGYSSEDSGDENAEIDMNVRSKYCGYWAEKEIRPLLAPGSVRPGSIKVNFNDSIDNLGMTYAGAVAFDIGNVPETTGKLFMLDANIGGNSGIQVGTVDYVTGKVVLFLEKFKGIEFKVFGAGPHTEFVNGQPQVYSIQKAENSFITITYESQQISAFAATYYLSNPDNPTAEVPHRGHLREGINYFEAFMDVNGDNIWNAGEPYGVATPFAVDVGWDQNSVNIELTDYMDSYLRYSVVENLRSTERWINGGAGSEDGGSDSGIDGSGAAEYKLTIKRTHINGSQVAQRPVVFEKMLKAPRNYVTEADLMEKGQLGFDWAFTTEATQAVYEVYISGQNINTNGYEDPIFSFTNNYSLVRAKAEIVSPVGGGYVYNARPVFKWKMPDAYPAYILQIKNAAGKVIYSTGPRQRPVTDNEGNCTLVSPIAAGDYIPSTGSIFQTNRKYTWQVIALSELYTLAAANNTYWSTSGAFRLDVNEPRQSGGYGGIKAKVKYFGPAKKFTNMVRFQVFDNAGFAGVPAASYTLSLKETESMLSQTATDINAHAWGLATQNGGYPYYAMAFIDSNNNGVRDAWESWGYANYYALDPKHPYDPLPINVDPEVTCPEVEIFIQDTDIDQDWFPDAWEYEQNPGADFLDKIGAFDSDNNDAEINWTLSTSGTRPAMSSMGMLLNMTGVTDSDNDGLADNMELLLGSAATTSSSAGDGYLDGAKAILGLTPNDSLSLVMGSVDNANVGWTVTVKKASDSASNAARSLLASSMSRTACAYEVQFRASLDSGTWQTVKSGTVTLEGTRSFSTDISDVVGQYPESGFFRVILSK